jgi:hypothetical protein
MGSGKRRASSVVAAREGQSAFPRIEVVVEGLLQADGRSEAPERQSVILGSTLSVSIVQSQEQRLSDLLFNTSDAPRTAHPPTTHTPESALGANIDPTNVPAAIRASHRAEDS